MTASASPAAIAALDGREVIWEPQPRQDVALACPAFELCYGGTKGCGKSDVVVMAPIDQIMYAEQRYLETGRKQRGRFVIFRKQLKNLTDLITRALELYPLLDPNVGIDGWTKMDKRFTFRSGFVVEFAHLEGPDDHLGYNGQELSGFAVDQLEDIEESVYLFLVMQVRSKDEGMRKLLRIVCTANPGGRHPGWVKSYFVEGCRPWNTIIKTEVKLSGGRKRVTTKAFIPAKLSDNKYLFDDGSYEANLMRLPEDMRRMYLDGDWDVVVGSYFGSVWSRPVHVIKSFPIPGSWPVKGGLDWGSSAPASAHWAAKDNDGNIYFIDELYTPGVTGRTYGEKMANRFKNQRWSAEKKYTMDEVYFLMDRQARQGQGADGRWANAAAGIASWGIRLFDANKDREARAEQWLERLIPERTTGKPRVYIFGDRCPHLVRIMPLLPRDEHNEKDIDHDSECHAYDSSGFVLMDWPLDTSVKDAPKSADKDVERWMELARRRRSMASNDNDDGGIHAGYGD